MIHWHRTNCAMSKDLYLNGKKLFASELASNPSPASSWLPPEAECQQGAASLAAWEKPAKTGTPRFCPLHGASSGALLAGPVCVRSLATRNPRECHLALETPCSGQMVPGSPMPAHGNNKERGVERGCIALGKSSGLATS